MEIHKTFWRCIWGKTLVTYARGIFTIFLRNKYCRKVVPQKAGFSRNICGKSFFRKRYLKEHCRCKHQSQEQYECEFWQ